MGNDPNVQIDVSPYVKDGATKWTVDIVDNGHGSKGGSGGFGQYPVLHVDAGQVNTIVTISIIKGGGWTFPHDGSAIWITDQGTTDPTGPALPLPSTIKNLTVFPNGAGLRFTDTNFPKAPQTLHYSLNFVNGAQKSSSLDPIIQNGGCCPGGGGMYASNSITLSTTTFAIDLAIAFAIGVFIAIIVQRIRRR